MRYKELSEIEPQVGDILGIEFGDVLIEAVIQDLREDGVVIELDSKAVTLLKEAALPARAPGFGNPEYISANPAKGFAVTRPDSPSVTYFPGITDYTTKLTGKTSKKDEPEKKQPKKVKPTSTVSMSDCENALDWGITTVQNFSPEIKSKLRTSGKGITLEYLAIVARQTDAYSDYNFSENELRQCEVFLSAKLDDGSIQSWDDLIQSNIDEATLTMDKKPMRKGDYETQADALHHRWLRASQANDKEEMEKVEQERNALDALARSGLIPEAEYQGRKVALGKPMKGDVKKSKVYVKGPKGNVVKVNFGDPNMKIKKSNPKRRKSFRARHNCDNPGPRWKARYWSCRAW